MKSSNLIAVLALAATPAFLHAQTNPPAYSDVVGYTKSSFVAGTTGQSVGFVKAAVFTGNATKVSSNSISATGLTTANNSLGPVNGLPSHYIEIIAGTNEGLNADILSNTGGLLVVNVNLTNVGTTEQIVIRPHIKASDIFSGNTDLVDYTDTLQVYNKDGSSTSVLRDSTSTTGWIDIDTFAPKDLVIYPGQAFVLSTSSLGNFTFQGVVKSNATIVPLYANGINFVSPGNPSSNPDIQSSGMGVNLTDYVDTAATFTSNGSFGQNRVVLWGGSTDKFIDNNTFNTVSDFTLPGTGAVLVSVQADTTWKVPAPYTKP